MINNNLAEKIPEIRVISPSINTIEERDLSSFSSESSFEDDEWFLDLYYKKVNFLNTYRRYNFAWIKDKNTKELVKKYIYKMILNSYSLNTIYHNHTKIKEFFAETSIKKIEDITHRTIAKYDEYLQSKKTAKNTSSTTWMEIKKFLSGIGHPMASTMDLYKYEFTQRKVIDEKYAPADVMEEFDRRMLKEEAPLSYKLAYWLLRLIPNRQIDVFSTNIECLKPYSGNQYTLCLKVFKHAGIETGITKIALLDIVDPRFKLLYDLIKEQQEVARKIYKEHPEKGDFLFLSYKTQYYHGDGKYYQKKQICYMDRQYFNNFLKAFAKRHKIMDGDEIADISGHMFRHNAITDRVETQLFRPIDLRPLTLHANEEMFRKAYYHKTDKELVEQTHEIEKKITGDTLIFKGKIVNSMNDAAFKFFLEQPAAFRLNGMGICVDSRSCSKDKLQCLECKYFIPDCDNLGYFEEQLDEWKNKLDYAKKMKNKIYEENVIYNISLFEKVVNKIKAQLEKGEEND